MNYNIVITTFSKRFNYVAKLITQIRKYTDNNIILVINGEKDGNFNEEYRKDILSLSLEYKNIFTNFFIETRGLSKMWNNGIITSTSDNVIVFNDDIEIHENIFTHIEEYIKDRSNFLTKINGSFSHYIVDKKLLETVGFFDERLLGFGEEDGDITYRLLEFNINIENINLSGLHNLISDTRHDHVKPGIGKYSNFNRNFIYNEKYKRDYNSKLKGMFDTSMSVLLPITNQYPYEQFFRLNKTNL